MTRYIIVAASDAERNAQLQAVPNAAGIVFRTDSDSLEIREPDGTVHTLDLADIVSAATIIAALPTSDPEVSGQVWNDAGVLKASAGA